MGAGVEGARIGVGVGAAAGAGVGVDSTVGIAMGSGTAVGAVGKGVGVAVSNGTAAGTVGGGVEVAVSNGTSAGTVGGGASPLHANTIITANPTTRPLASIRRTLTDVARSWARPPVRIGRTFERITLSLESILTCFTYSPV